MATLVALTVLIGTMAAGGAADDVTRCGMEPDELKALGARLSKAKAVEGRSGAGLRAIASIPVGTLFNHQEGTVGFWFKPEWDGAKCQAPGRAFFQCFSKKSYKYNSVFCGVYNDMIYVFVTDANKKRFQVQAACRGAEDSPWKKDQWLHVGFTWKNATGEIKLFINGKQAAARKVPPIKQAADEIGEVFSLRPADVKGTMDDFFISKQADPTLIQAEMSREAGK